MAKSVGTNAVVVRRIVGLLQEAGLVTTQPGSQGGTTLAVEADQITLLDIYDAVQDQSVFCLHDPHSQCPVACSVKRQVDQLITQAEDRMKDDLAQTRLREIAEPAVTALEAMMEK